MVKRRSDPPRPSTIAKFWRYRIIGADDLPGYPVCFCCRRNAPVDDWDDATGAGYLQRAHLVAHCYGGPFTVPNLWLLCPPCHRAFDRVLQIKRHDALYRLGLLAEELKAPGETIDRGRWKPPEDVPDTPRPRIPLDDGWDSYPSWVP